MLLSDRDAGSRSRVADIWKPDLGPLYNIPIFVNLEIYQAEYISRYTKISFLIIVYPMILRYTTIISELRKPSLLSDTQVGVMAFRARVLAGVGMAGP